MARRRPDTPSLVAGLAIAAFGTIVLLDASDVLALSFAALGPLACALVGIILVAVGLSRRD